MAKFKIRDIGDWLVDDHTGIDRPDRVKSIVVNTFVEILSWVLFWTLIYAAMGYVLSGTYKYAVIGAIIGLTAGCLFGAVSGSLDSIIGGILGKLLGRGLGFALIGCTTGVVLGWFLGYFIGYAMGIAMFGFIELILTGESVLGAAMGRIFGTLFAVYGFIGGTFLGFVAGGANGVIVGLLSTKTDSGWRKIIGETVGMGLVALAAAIALAFLSSDPVNAAITIGGSIVVGVLCGGFLGAIRHIVVPWALEFLSDNRLTPSSE
jgi:hypothetical protein